MAETSLAGFEWLVYQNTADNYASPTWAKITRIRDVTITIGNEELNDSSRDSLWHKYLAGLTELSISFQMEYNKGNTDHNTLITNMLSRKVFEMAVMNGDIATANNEGIRAFGQLLQHDLSLPLSDNSLIDFTFRPAFFDESGEIDPEWWTVPGP